MPASTATMALRPLITHQMPILTTVDNSASRKRCVLLIFLEGDKVEVETALEEVRGLRNGFMLIDSSER